MSTTVTVTPTEPKFSWQPASSAPPIVLKYPSGKPVPRRSSEWKTAVILPDPQIGYRSFEDVLDPFHDEQAMDVALQIIQLLQRDTGVDKIVNLGDFLDLPAQGKYEQEPAFAFTTQYAIDRGARFLAEQRLHAPDAHIVVLEGNHDRRMQKFISINAQSALGLRRAKISDEDAQLPVMTLPYLLRMDEMNIEYIDAYPAGVHWINPRFRAIHGDKVRSNGSTASAVVNENPHFSTVFGHIHRVEQQGKRVPRPGGGSLLSYSVSPGCLCRIDGAVPSVRGSVGMDGRPAVVTENWQQGLAIITYLDEPDPDDMEYVELLTIHQGRTLFRGQEIASTAGTAPNSSRP